MKALIACASAALAAASLAGCTTGAGGGAATRGAEVTRFHLNQPIARGQIAIEAFDAADANSIEFRSYAAAVARELSRLGWTVVNTVGQSEQVALVDVEQGSREALRQRSPVSVGVGAGTGSFGSGAGVGIGINLGGNRSRDIVATLLEVRIKRRSDGTVFWEGRATDEALANSPNAARTAAVDMLAQALFRDFPGESGRTISVR